MDFVAELLFGLLRAIGFEVYRGRRSDPLTGVGRIRTPTEAREFLHRTADRLGLQAEDEPGGVHMTGEIQARAVELWVEFNRAQDQIRFRIRADVHATSALPAGLGFVSPADAPAGAWTLGDPALDRLLRVTGDEALGALALAPTVREYVVGVSGQVEVEADRLRFSATRAATFLPGLVASLCALCGLLESTPALSAEALARRFDHEPLATVRARLLSALVTRHSEAYETQQACLQALGDPSPKLRLRGASHLGEDGRMTLRALVLDAEVEAGLRFAALGRYGDLDEVAASKLEAQLDFDEARALAAARLLGRGGGPRSLRALTDLSRDKGRPRRLREAAQQAVARIQARNPEARQGHLSLAEEPRGALSHPGEAGAVSPLPDPTDA